MRLKGLTLTINFNSFRSFIRSFKRKKKPEINDEFEAFGCLWKLYEANDEDIKAVKVE